MLTDDGIKRVALDMKCWAISGSEHGTSTSHNSGIIALAREIEKLEREACAKVCEEESGVAAEMGHERFARYSAEMAGKIRMRSNTELSGSSARMTG